MNSCEFCKEMWIAVLMIALSYLLITGLAVILQQGINKVCFEAYLDKVHLNNCDDSEYPVKEKP